ncbi:MAG: Arc family DNA-binding protein [Burkholderiales bacterium]|nr:Arc family DNA-binding protein [Burkholderiales bacterium]
MIASAKDKSVQLRFPDRRLLKRLDVAARRNGRSRNTEILIRLLASFSRPAGHDGARSAT